MVSLVITSSTLIVVLFFGGYGHCDPERDRRFIIFGDNNIGIALSFGGSIGSGVISSSKFKRKSFTAKHGTMKKQKHKHEYNHYGPGIWLPWWSPPHTFVK